MGRVVMRYPDVPPELDDRAQDGWEPLLAIAESAGQLQRARQAAVKLHGGADADDDTLGVRLLADLRDAFGARDRVSSEELVDTLVADDEAPWGDLRGRALDSRKLARLLRPYGVRPGVVRIGDKTARGYTRSALVDVWERYTPLQPVADHAPVTPSPRSEPLHRNTAGQGTFSGQTPESAQTAPDQHGYGVTDENRVQPLRTHSASTQSDVDYDRALDQLTREFDPVEVIRGDMPWAHVTGGDAA